MFKACRKLLWDIQWCLLFCRICPSSIRNYLTLGCWEILSLLHYMNQNMGLKNWSHARQKCTFIVTHEKKNHLKISPWREIIFVSFSCLVYCYVLCLLTMFYIFQLSDLLLSLMSFSCLVLFLFLCWCLSTV